MNPRLRRCAGRCRYYRKLDKLVIEYSEQMFAGMTEQEKTGTVQHEMAHAVCFRTNVGDNHDAGWKRVCYEMGGDSERLLRTKAEVKKNLVRRIVLTDTVNSYNLMVRTKMQAERLLAIRRGVVSLGCIVINGNDKTYKWETARSDDIKLVKVLKESAGWKLIA